MPAPTDLNGQRLGALTVLRRGADLTTKAPGKTWIVRCDCGNEECYPQRRLTQNHPKKPAVRACSACEAPTCVVCGGKLSRRGPHQRNTCSETCRQSKLRGIWRSHWHRVVASAPTRRAAATARAKARHAERAAVDPAYVERVRQLKLESMARRRADPDRYERYLRYQREHYAAHRARIWATRRAYLDGLDGDALARWVDRARAYGRAYRQRWRTELVADPSTHQKSLDLRAQSRRRRRLLALLITPLPTGV